MKSKLSIGLLRKAGRCQQSRIRLTQEGDSGWAAPPLQMLGDAPLGGSQPSVRTEGGHPARTSVQSFVAVFHLLPSTPAFFAGGLTPSNMLLNAFHLPLCSPDVSLRGVALIREAQLQLLTDTKYTQLCSTRQWSLRVCFTTCVLTEVV